MVTFLMSFLCKLPVKCVGPLPSERGAIFQLLFAKHGEEKKNLLCKNKVPQQATVNGCKNKTRSTAFLATEPCDEADSFVYPLAEKRRI